MKLNPANNNIIEVGGITQLTTIDYPGKLAAVIFLKGCPWQCRYCQNIALLPKKSETIIPWQAVLEFLETRLGLLDAVVFSGGEATMQLGLQKAILQVKKLGFKIGLHTAGIYPDRLEQLLPLLDWVGLDIKSAIADYQDITLTKGSGERAWKSAKLLVNSDVPYEFRTTLHPDLLSQQQISALVSELNIIGTKNFVFQCCITKNCLDESLNGTNSTLSTAKLQNAYAKYFKEFSVRNI